MTIPTRPFSPTQLALVVLLLLTPLFFGVLLCHVPPSWPGDSGVTASVPDDAAATPQLTACEGSERSSLEDLPPSVRTRLEEHDYEVVVAATGSHHQAVNPAHGMAVTFSCTGFTVKPHGGRKDWTLSCRLVGVGRGARLQSVTTTAMRARGTRMEYERVAGGGLGFTEWYVNTKRGLEQGFTLPEPPQVGRQPVTLALKLDGDLEAGLAGSDAVAFRDQDQGGKAVLRYRELHVFDADSRELPSHMRLEGELLTLVIDDCDASYPLTVDPLVTSAKEAKLVAADGSATDGLGYSVAISNKVCVVGAPWKNSTYVDQGAVYVFEDTSPNGDWSSYSETKLTAGTEAANTRANFGHAVAIRGDTILVGAPGYGTNQTKEGRVFVFRRNGGMWPSIPNAVLRKTMPAVNEFFGQAVALSEEQDVAVVGELVRYETSFEFESEIRANDGNGGGDLDQWGMFEEIVGGEADLYEENLGAVRRSDDFAQLGSHSLLLWSNAAQEAPEEFFPPRPNQYQQKNNHVIAQRQLFTHGVTGKWRYEFRFYVPDLQDPTHVGRTGPEWSMQSTRDVAGVGRRTHITGIQYIPDPDAGGYFAKWQIWTPDESGAVAWRLEPLSELNNLPLSERRVEPGSWYFTALEVDYTQNKYIKLVLRGPNIDRTFDLSTVAIKPEDKFQTAIPSFWISVEGQNQFKGLTNQSMRHYKIYYDRIRLTKDGGAVYVFEPSSFVGELTPSGTLSASDAQAFDFFGHSVGISNQSVVAGAYGRDEASVDQGAAYVFKRPSGGWASQFEDAKLTAGSAGDHFGYGVAISADKLAIGAPGHGNDTGIVYPFLESNSVWQPEFSVTGWAATAGHRVGAVLAMHGSWLAAGVPDHGGTGLTYLFRRAEGAWLRGRAVVANDRGLGDRYGTTVALERSSLAVGAPARTEAAAGSGAAYTYRLRVMPEQVLHAGSFGGSGDQFGFATAVDGDRAVVGAFGHDGNGKENSGAAYIFERDAQGVWQRITRLIPGDAAAFDWFGFAVGISGDAVVVGAPFASITGSSTTGKAYVFRRDGSGVWFEEQTLIAGDAATHDRFGHTVAIDGDTVVVGVTRRENRITGKDAAYVFERADTWMEKAKLTDTSASSTAYLFASAVDVSGDTVVVGAVRDASGGAFPDPAGSGAAFVYQRPAAGWTNQTTATAVLRPTGSRSADGFGSAVAIEGGTIVVGALTDATNGTDAGAGYVFQGSGATWSQQAKLTASNAKASDHLGRVVGISFDTVVMTAAGVLDPNPSLTGSAYVFVAPPSGWADATELFEVTASDGGGDRRFPHGLAIAGSTLLLGGTLADHGGNNTGSTYAFKLPFEETPQDDNVVIQPVDPTTGTQPVELTFESVGEAGTTTVTTSAAGPVLPVGFKLGEPPTVYNIETTATVSGTTKICIDYSEVSFTEESALKLFHFENGEWVVLPSSIDTTNKKICGETTSLSPFAVVERATKPFGEFRVDDLEIDLTEKELELDGEFTPGATSNGFDPRTELVTMEVGSFSVVIPAGSFELTNPGKYGTYKFTGSVGAVAMKVEIRGLKDNRFTFDVDADNVDLSGTQNPVKVTLAIGDDAGTRAVTAEFE